MRVNIYSFCFCVFLYCVAAHIYIQRKNEYNLQSNFGKTNILLVFYLNSFSLDVIVEDLTILK